MTSNVEICNVALTFLERKRITSLTDGTTSGNDCNAIFEPTRQSLIRGHDWNFARSRVKLARTTDTPVSEFDYEYQLPSDWLRTIVVADNDNAVPGVEYRTEGLTVLASSEDVYLTYLKDVTDPAAMPPDFRQMFSYELAIQLAKTNTDRDRATEARDTWKNKATSTDSIEDFPKKRPAGTWIAQRFNNRGPLRA